MLPWFTVSQLLDHTVAEHQQGPENTASAEWLASETGAGIPRENTASADWLDAETNAGMPAAAQDYSRLQTAGAIMVLAGTASAAIGTLFAVRSQQATLKSQSLSMENEAAISNINARRAEREAQSILKSSQEQIGALTLEAGAEKAERSAVMAGRGIRLGVGSAAEVQASGDVITGLNRMAIGVSAARAAASARTQAVNERNRGLFAGVSARNLRLSAGNDFAPIAAASGSLLESGGRLGMQWATDRRYPALRY